MIKNITVTTLLTLAMTEAFAEDWTSIIKDDAHEVLVDIDSYNVSQNLPYLTAKTVHKTAQSLDVSSKNIQYFTRVSTLQFNCKQPLYRAKLIQLFDKENKLVDTIEANSHFNKLSRNTDTFAIGQLTCQVHQMLGG